MQKHSEKNVFTGEQSFISISLSDDRTQMKLALANNIVKYFKYSCKQENKTSRKLCSF